MVVGSIVTPSAEIAPSNGSSAQPPAPEPMPANVPAVSSVNAKYRGKAIREDGMIGLLRLERLSARPLTSSAPAWVLAIRRFSGEPEPRGPYSRWLVPSIAVPRPALQHFLAIDSEGWSKPPGGADSRESDMAVRTRRAVVSQGSLPTASASRCYRCWQDGTMRDWPCMSDGGRNCPKFPTFDNATHRAPLSETALGGICVLQLGWPPR